MSTAIGWIDTNLPRVCGLAAALMILGIGLTLFKVGLPETWLLGPLGFVLVAFGFAARTTRRRVARLPSTLIAATALVTGVLSALPRDRVSPLWGVSSVAVMAALMISNRRLYQGSRPRARDMGRRLRRRGRGRGRERLAPSKDGKRGM